MIGVLTVLFIILSLFLAIFIYIQQGKGDMGLGGLGGGSQTLFGGSGGQEFFERATWLMGALFILGALGLAMLKTTSSESRITGYHANTAEKAQPALPKEAPVKSTTEEQK